MKKIALILITLISIPYFATAQQTEKSKRQKRFSLEEFKQKQKVYITEKAELTAEEAEAFFPLFFELQKKKWLINKETREKLGIKCGEECSEEKSILMANELAETKIKIAQLEKEYMTLYLNVIPAKKILLVWQAEERFQRDLIKKMCNTNRGGNRDRKAPKTD
ncbi:MAG: hypothetical protein IKD40_04870 [Bacteroidaceae bacterium]|nr:hypothetical protein [Bacteroidaceae bacterium]